MGTAMQQEQEVACPKCGGRTWDNRLSKRNPKAPDFKCRDKSCDGAVWPPKGQQAPSTAQQRQQANAPQPYSIGAVPGMDDQASDERAFVQQVNAPQVAAYAVPQTLVETYRACLKAARELAAQEMPSGMQTPPEVVQSMAATLLIQWSRR